MLILLTSPKANYYAHQGEIRHAVSRVLESGTYVGGSEVAKFEAEFAEYIGRKHAIGVNSGTDALIIALRALGSHTVSVRADTALATVAAILDAGLVPNLVDESYPADLPVHLYGKAANTELAVIEDCAQSCGGFYKKKRLGTFGVVGCFSFYPTKNLGAIGDGGMIVTNDDDLAKVCRQIREYGWDGNRLPHRIGFNSRLDPIQAAILRVKLPYLDEENDRRREIASIYDEELYDIVETPDPEDHCFHLYVIQCDKRDALAAELKAKKIQTGIHYATPIHLEPVYKNHVKVDCDLSGIEKRARRILSLPMYPELTDREVSMVIAAIRTFYKGTA